MVCGRLELFCGRAWDPWARRDLECCMNSLMGYSDGAVEILDADRMQKEKRECAHEVAVRKKDSTRDHSCFILPKNKAVFCLCPEV